MNKFRQIAFSILRSLQDRHIYHYAASLSFYSVMAIIPFIFLSLSLFTQMPSFKEYYNLIMNFVAGSLLPAHQEIVGEHLENFLQNSSKLGITGLVAMVITSLMFFSNFEFVVTTLARTKARSFWTRVSVYWTLMTLMPLALASSFYLSHFVQKMLNASAFTKNINFLELLPFLIILAIFSVTYAICINRKVPLWRIFGVGFIASGVWNISKLFFISYVFYNKSYESIYGSLSTLLFFFVWLYVSWIIFLFGLKACVYGLDTALDSQDNPQNPNAQTQIPNPNNAHTKSAKGKKNQ